MSGNWLGYIIYLHQAKEEMKQYIKCNPHDFNVIEFTITPQNKGNYSLQDDGNEVAYNDVLYDIVAKKDKAGIVVLSCLKDLNETGVINAYNNKIIKQNKQSSNSKAAEQYHYSNQIYDDVRFTVSLDHPCKFISCPLLAFKNVLCHEVLAEVATPPPQLNV